MFPRRFDWHEIDGALVVVDSVAGDATFLNPSASLLWLALSEAPQSETSLALVLTDHFSDIRRGDDLGI